MCQSPDRRPVATAVITMFLAVVPARTAPFAGGNGGPANPYQITTAEQLISLGSDPNLLDKHFVVLNDIDLDPNLPGGRVFAQGVIAPDMNDSVGFQGISFTGSLDGGGHSVLNLTMARDAAQYLSLFGSIGKGAVVRNLRIEGASVSAEGGRRVGALAGANGGRIFRCDATARVSSGEYVGVLAGLNTGEIIECRAGGKVGGAADVGGLAGLNCGVIINCGAASDVSATTGDHHGGLVGKNDFEAVIAQSYALGNVSAGTEGPNDLGGLVGSLSSGSISDCYAGGDVSGRDDCNSLGGLVGEVWGYVSNSYSTGRVSAGKNSEGIGGLAGHRPGGEITGCFWDMETSGLSQSAGGTWLTTAEMQGIGVFLIAGWDWANEHANGTADLWFTPPEGGYPMLTLHSDAFHPQELDGSGTMDDPYRIATAEDLGAINHYDPTACYRLDADVDLAGIAWNKAPVQYLAGRFDGNGKVVTGLRIHGHTHLGLFATLGQDALVESLGIHDARITGRHVLGLLAGANRSSIRACRADGSIIGACHLADVTTVHPCSVGGLTAHNEGSICDSYAVGSMAVDLTSDIGGLVASNAGAISRCYAAAEISWRTLLPPNGGGGLVGVNRLLGKAGSIQDSCFLIKADDGGPDNGLGAPLTSAQMKQKAGFAGWDFETVWTICEGKDSPRLRWEGVDCNQP